MHTHHSEFLSFLPDGLPPPDVPGPVSAFSQRPPSRQVRGPITLVHSTRISSRVPRASAAGEKVTPVLPGNPSWVWICAPPRGGSRPLVHGACWQTSSVPSTQGPFVSPGPRCGALQETRSATQAAGRPACLEAARSRWPWGEAGRRIAPHGTAPRAGHLPEGDEGKQGD